MFWQLYKSIQLSLSVYKTLKLQSQLLNTTTRNKSLWCILYCCNIHIQLQVWVLRLSRSSNVQVFTLLVSLLHSWCFLKYSQFRILFYCYKILILEVDPLHLNKHAQTVHWYHDTELSYILFQIKGPIQVTVTSVQHLKSDIIFVSTSHIHHNGMCVRILGKGVLFQCILGI